MNRKQVGLFILTVIFIFVFDRLLAELINNMGVRFYSKKDFTEKFIDNKRDSYDTLIMGSSRTKKSIFPYYLYRLAGLKAKNVARNACSAKFNYLFYMNYKKYAPPPRLVIYGVDYFIFSLRSNPRWLRYFKSSDNSTFLKKRGILRLIDNKKQIDVLLNNFIDWIGEKNFSERKELPFIDDFTGIAGKISGGSVIPAQYKKYPYKKYPGREGVYFGKLLDELKGDRVTVILVYIPEYIGTYRSNFQKEKFHKDILNITKPFRNIYILNYNKPGTFPLERKDYFVDGEYGNSNSHMSKTGAKKFNRMLIRDIKRILSRRKL